VSSSDFRLREEQMSEAWPSKASLRAPAWRRKAEGAVAAEELSAVSAQRAPSSLPGAAAEGVAAYVRAAPLSAEPVGSDVRPEAATVALDARGQPREAAVAEPGVEPEAEPDAELAAGAAGAAERDAARQPEAAVQDAVLRPGAERDAVLRQEAERDAVLPPAAGPLVVLSACPQVPGLAPGRAAQFAHAMRKLPAVPRSEQWWPAAGCEGLS
jgi:hypothetical protein